MASKPSPVRLPSGWRVEQDGKRASVEVETRDFVQAVDVINRIKDVAERLEHHPDLHLERWNHLRITTYSHDVGHLTDRDERLAGEIARVLSADGLAPR